MAADVLVIGEALVDVLPTEGGTVRRPGGSPANVAVGLARLGVPTTLLTCFADDADGLLLAQHLSAAGVRVLRPGQPATTSVAEAVLDEEGQATYRIDLTWDLAGVRDVGEPDAVHVGSLAATEPPGCDDLLAVARSRQGRSLLSYDLNCRPAVMGTPARVLDRMTSLVQLADVVKLSDEDAAWLWPGDAPDEVLQRLLGLGAGLAVMTLGRYGCLARDGGELIAVPAVDRGPVVDTVGAGDAFMAGLLAGLLPRPTGREALVAALELGSLVARRTCERAGADPPRREEL